MLASVVDRLKEHHGRAQALRSDAGSSSDEWEIVLMPHGAAAGFDQTEKTIGGESQAPIAR
jgi:hypothetical protein